MNPLAEVLGGKSLAGAQLEEHAGQPEPNDAEDGDGEILARRCFRVGRGVGTGHGHRSGNEGGVGLFIVRPRITLRCMRGLWNRPRCGASIPAAQGREPAVIAKAAARG